ncbi:MAG: hypothetical protein M1820_000359 [Bogoriella megaspora]|nr:MAG: hypothetical protein M1820_000359 [Bogoriella megaspora]
MPAESLFALALETLLKFHSAEKYSASRRRYDSFMDTFRDDSDARDQSNTTEKVDYDPENSDHSNSTHKEGCSSSGHALDQGSMTSASLRSVGSSAGLEAFASPVPRMQSFIPPRNYGAVVPGYIFRSGFPQEENLSFLESLKLKTIITLVPDEVAPSHAKWMEDNNIRHLQIPIRPNKEDKSATPILDLNTALTVLLHRETHPILIHCNQGRHRTGCVVACFRRVIGEELLTAISEYHTYADPKARPLDEAFISNYDTEILNWAATSQRWVEHPEIGSRSVTPIPRRRTAPQIKA